MQNNRKIRMFALLFIAIAIFYAVFPCSKKSQDSYLQRYSQEYGAHLWEQIQSSPIQLSLDDVILGMKKRARGEKIEEREDDQTKTLADMYKASLEEKSKENLARSEEYLAQIAKKHGVIALEAPKLYYEIKTQGNSLEESPLCLFHYAISTIDGEEIINTWQEGSPKNIDVECTFAAFAKGIQGMKKGERRILYAHPDLAYRTHRYVVPQNIAIIIEVEAN